MTRRTRADVGAASGAILVALGVFLIFGLGWSLVILGVTLLVVFIVIYDVDEPEKPVLESALRPRPIQDWSEQP